MAAQINPIVGDLKGNAQKILQVLDRARRGGIYGVLFPELCLCGYPPEDLLLYPPFIEEMQGQLQRIQQETEGLVAVVGLARRSPSGEKRLYNSAAVLSDGQLLGFYDKWLLPTYDVFDERRYFEPGTGLGVWMLAEGTRVGVTICEDIWEHAKEVPDSRYLSDPVQALAPRKLDLLLNLSASPYHFQKPGQRVKVACSAAKTLRCPTLVCCQVGANDELVFDGYSLFVDAQGDLCKVGKGFVEDELCVDLEERGPPVSMVTHPMQDLYRALVLGIRDYFGKQGFTKGCLGLSGGIDSALTACLAAEALGKENLLAIAMPSRYSSPSSLADAIALAHNLHIELWQLPIESLFQNYLDALEPRFFGLAADVTEENLQARIRGNLLMAISNKLGCIVLSTGNKSEMAMGYSTLYGDMCGGLSVLSDVSKTQVYALSRWINQAREIIPFSTIEKPPSAELRENQKDSDSLPDYAVVDAVLQDYVEDVLSLEEIAHKEQLPEQLVRELIQRIHRAEYKRRQAPPGIRVTKKSFRAGRRFPVVQKWIS